MNISFTVEGQDIFQLQLDPEIEIENIKALIETECGVPVHRQALLYNGNLLSDPKQTLKQIGVQDNDIILVRKTAPAQGAGNQPQDSISQQIEHLRREILSNPQLSAQLLQTNPQLLEAARDPNPAKFSQLIQEMEKKKREEEYRAMMEIEALNQDPFSIENQRLIEERIRAENINSNWENAMEHIPESFGRVFMLYINCSINNTKATAFVDSGAQMTIINSTFAEKCGLMHLIDKRWTGIAKGVGSAKILGRIHIATLQIGNMFLPCSFTVLEDQSIDVLLGLDMLKRHQCIIDLSKNVLRIGETEAPFLGESEIPKSFGFDEDETKSTPKESNSTSTSSNSNSNSTPSNTTTSSTKTPTTQTNQVPNTTQSPNTSSTVKSNSNPTPTSNPQRNPPTSGNNPFAFPPLDFSSIQIPQSNQQRQQQPTQQRPPQRLPQQPTQPQFPEEMIQSLMSFGATRQQAIEALIASGGNVDIAAGFLLP